METKIRLFRLIFIEIIVLEVIERKTDFNEEKNFTKSLRLLALPGITSFL